MELNFFRKIEMDFFELADLQKHFGDNHVVNGVSFAVRRGEVFSLLGPSGCGKTTILRMIGGFEEPDNGKIFLDGREITNLPPNKRKINTVFQNYALFPHMSVSDNIAFGPRTSGIAEERVQEMVDNMLDIIRLKDLADRMPDNISGGQKQRIAIARALINNPHLLLLDEPLAALDLKLRQYMLLELDRIHDEVGTTFIYVTHDQGEAMSLSDRIAVMNSGKIEQIGTPAEIYENPKTKFVASFIGDTNFFDGVVMDSIDSEYTRIDMKGLGEFPSYNEKKLARGANVTVSIRPEKFSIFMKKPSENLNACEGRVEDIVYQGAQTRYWVRVKEHRINIVMQHNRCSLDFKQPTWDDNVWIAWHRDDVTVLESNSPD